MQCSTKLYEHAKAIQNKTNGKTTKAGVMACWQVAKERIKRYKAQCSEHEEGLARSNKRVVSLEETVKNLKQQQEVQSCKFINDMSEESKMEV